MNYKNLTVDISSGGLAVITLNRPEVHNAFNAELIASLSDAIIFCTQEDSIRVILLSANGQTFSAGADLNWMRDSMAMSKADNINDAKRFAELLKLFKNCTKPTIAKINGAAYGGAIGLICCCDIAIATESSEFCFAEVKLGLIPATISPYVISVIGEKAARRFFMTAEMITGQTAKEIGLIDELVDKDKIDISCSKIIKSILSNRPIAVREAKQLVKTVVSLNNEDDVKDITAKLISEIRVTPEAQAALNDFLNKHTEK